MGKDHNCYFLGQLPLCVLLRWSLKVFFFWFFLSLALAKLLSELKFEKGLTSDMLFRAADVYLKTWQTSQQTLSHFSVPVSL